MKGTIMRTVLVGCALIAFAMPASAQVDLTGSYQTRMYEDYIERGPGEFMGNYTGMPLTDEGRAKALLYTSNLPSTIERQCLAQAPWVGLYRPLGMRIWTSARPMTCGASSRVTARRTHSSRRRASMCASVSSMSPTRSSIVSSM